LSTLVSSLQAALARLAPPGAGMVVAVSGGADSLALLLGLLEIRPPTASSPLVVAHFNHRLRGAESDGDEAFVRALHARLSSASEGLLLACGQAEGHLGNEQDARSARYDWLVQVAREQGLNLVATAHTADDQAETVLHRLLRGAGITGLCGIPERRCLAPGVMVVRPLLSVRRSAVLEFLRQRGQDFRQDSSNLDPTFTRNRIRQQLLPLLRANYNPGVVEVLCRLARQCEELRQAEAEAASELLQRAEKPRAGRQIILDCRTLAGSPRRLVRGVLRLVWEREGWPQGAMGFDDWERLAGLVFGEGSAQDCPGGVQACVVGVVLRLGRETPGKSEAVDGR
jgi:tRNA(Ile)-lysidine synthase